MERVKLTPFVPEKDCIDLAISYARVFADPPWNEYTRCNNCQAFFGKLTLQGQSCLNASCSGELGLAYPLDQTVSYLLKETKRPERLTVANILRGGEKCVGFGFGYQSTLEEFTKDKYSKPESREMLNTLFSKLQVCPEVFYISEVGVEAEYRGRGFSNLLVDALVCRAKEAGLGLLMRTNQDSPMVAVARRAKMAQVLGPEVGVVDELVPNGLGGKLVRKLVVSSECVNGWDPENPARVLFVANPPVKEKPMIALEDRCVAYLGG